MTGVKTQPATHDPVVDSVERFPVFENVDLLCGDPPSVWAHTIMRVVDQDRHLGEAIREFGRTSLIARVL